ncbi:MAG: hypothetical protein ACOXZV_01535 [Bacteroidales bacterium]|jgi:hypothetical protein
MTFNNSKTIIGFRLKLFIATIILIAYFLLAYVAKLIKFPLLGMGDNFWTILLVACYVVLLFLPMILNYQYIYFSDDGDKIIFRYYTSGIISGSKNSVEIDKKTFTYYKVEKRLLGLVQSIILFQRLEEGVAKYPPIYISSLKKEERNKIYRSLNALTQKI